MRSGQKKGNTYGSRTTVSIGDIVKRTPQFLNRDKDSNKRAQMDGKVKYVHPRGRFHVVEFVLGCVHIRESFPGIGIYEQPDLGGKD